MATALRDTCDAQWREDATKVVILVADAPPHDQQMGAALVNRAACGGVPCDTTFLTAITDAFWEHAAKQSRIEQPIVPVVVNGEEEQQPKEADVEMAKGENAGAGAVNKKRASPSAGEEGSPAKKAKVEEESKAEGGLAPVASSSSS